MDLKFKVFALVLSQIWTTDSENMPPDKDIEGDCLSRFISIENDNNRINNIKVQSKYENNIKMCKILLNTDINYRLRALVDYSPTVLSNCQSQFLHIGNDKLRPNQVSLTSYKYCDREVSEEIVSRKNFLWIVYPKSGNSSDFRVSLSARKEVTCSEGQFECSPIQCVEEERVCDKVAHCENKRDEYCVLDTDLSDPDEPCFRCADGTCIRPKLPRYNDNWGKPLWYLCDNVRHCADGTDEQPDICGNGRGRRNKVITCRSAEHPGRTEIMWTTGSICDGLEDCDIQDQTECNNKDDEPSGNVLFMPILIVAIAVIVVAMGFCIIHKRILLMARKSPPDEAISEPTNVTYEDDNVNTDITQTRGSQYRFNICHGGRPSADTLPEEKQCVITTV